MSEQAKRILRESALRVPYLWLANRYRGIKRLFGYPDTARVGVVDYDEYWDAKAPNTMGMLSPWRLRRAQAFATMLRPGDRVLDLGVGDGALLRYLIDTVGIEGYGIDLSPRAVDFCHILGLNVILGDVNRPIHDILSEGFGADSIFDVVICSEIIEHLPDPEALLLSLRAVARKGIIVSIPNTGFHQHRLRLLFGKFPLQWVITPGEHLRYWTRTDFHWWARQLGFTIAREVPYQGTAGLKDIAPGWFAAAFAFYLTIDPSKR